MTDGEIQRCARCGLVLRQHVPLATYDIPHLERGACYPVGAVIHRTIDGAATSWLAIYLGAASPYPDCEPTTERGEHD